MKTVTEWRETKSVDLDLLQRCKAAIRSVVPDAKVILYGSRARGDASADSDYDLLVIFDEDNTLDLRRRIRHELFPIELETDHVLTLNAYSISEWSRPMFQVTPFFKNVEREGVLL
jgi:predicted nucleotidyltransferase